MLGHRVPALFTAGGAIAPEAAVLLCRIAFLPASVLKRVTTGRKAILRAKVLMVGFPLRMQTFAFAPMLTALGFLIRRPDEGHTGNFVAMGVSHPWDESNLMLRDRLLADSPFAKQPAQRIGKTILAQNSMVHVVGAVNAESSPDVLHRAETFVVAPLELAGKTTDYSAQGILRSMAILLDDRPKLREIASRLSALVATLRADAANTNKRFMKHLAALTEDAQWPANVVFDNSQKCLLHQLKCLLYQLHRIKLRQLEGHALVGLSYCLPGQCMWNGLHMIRQRHCRRRCPLRSGWRLLAAGRNSGCCVPCGLRLPLPPRPCALPMSTLRRTCLRWLQRHRSPSCRRRLPRRMRSDKLPAERAMSQLVLRRELCHEYFGFG